MKRVRYGMGTLSGDAAKLAEIELELAMKEVPPPQVGELTLKPLPLALAVVGVLKAPRPSMRLVDWSRELYPVTHAEFGL